jgi:hypothetical protein
MFEIGDRIAYRAFHGNVVELLDHDMCMVRLDTGHLVSAPLAELRLVEKVNEEPDSGKRPS